MLHACKVIRCQHDCRRFTGQSAAANTAQKKKKGGEVTQTLAIVMLSSQCVNQQQMLSSLQLLCLSTAARHCMTTAYAIDQFTTADAKGKIRGMQAIACNRSIITAAEEEAGKLNPVLAASMADGTQQSVHVRR